MRSTFRSEAAPFEEAVFICSKCAAKVGRGRRGKTELRGEIKHALKAQGLGKKIRIVETTCLDLCPKGGQTVATLHLLAIGELVVVDGDASGEAVVERLFGSKSLASTPDRRPEQGQDVEKAVR